MWSHNCAPQIRVTSSHLSCGILRSGVRSVFLVLFTVADSVERQTALYTSEGPGQAWSVWTMQELYQIRISLLFRIFAACYVNLDHTTNAIDRTGLPVET